MFRVEEQGVCVSVPVIVIVPVPAPVILLPIPHKTEKVEEEIHEVKIEGKRTEQS